MTVLTQRVSKGEVPRVPANLLPEGCASYALNCDLQHGEIRGIASTSIFASGIAVGGKAPRTVYTEDGSVAFAWSQQADVVKSQVVDDQHYRIYYTIQHDDGPLIKVARTKRNVGGVITTVIGTAAVGGNYQPPENSSPGQGFGNTGPDSWVLGVPKADASGSSDPDADAVPPTLSLVDRSSWPSIPNLGLRAIFFLEDPSGQIVAQVDITNSETVHPSVIYTASGNNTDRGHKIQDMMWPLGNQVKPYKFYWFAPPTFDDTPIARTVEVANNLTGPIVITYGASEPTVPNDPINRPVDQA